MNRRAEFVIGIVVAILSGIGTWLAVPSERLFWWRPSPESKAQSTEPPSVIVSGKSESPTSPEQDRADDPRTAKKAVVTSSRGSASDPPTVRQSGNALTVALASLDSKLVEVPVYRDRVDEIRKAIAPLSLKTELEVCYATFGSVEREAAGIRSLTGAEQLAKARLILDRLEKCFARIE